MSKTELTAERLRELLNYDPETGVLTYLVPRGRMRAGDRAGHLEHDGYVRVLVMGKHYPAHRLAWLYQHGSWPAHKIDHIDGQRANNVFSNLRDVSTTVNAQNQKGAQSRNKTGLLGVSPSGRGWKAIITIDGVQSHLGTYDTPFLAHEAYLRTKRAQHPGCTI